MYLLVLTELNGCIKLPITLGSDFKVSFYTPILERSDEKEKC